MNKTLLSSFALLGLLLLLTPRQALAIEINTNSPAPAVVDMEDSQDLEDEDDGCDPPAGNDGPSGDGSPCAKNSAPGMAVWRVSEPYINLWLDDTPLRYRLSSGRWMELTLSYKQRGETREEFIGGFGPGWSCNWLGLVVRTNVAQSRIFLHKAGGGREILTLGSQSPRTQGRTVCCMAPCPWDGSVQIDSPTGSSRTYTAAVCSPDPNVVYLFRSFCADRYGRGTTYNWAGYQPGATCYARLNTVADRDGRTCTLAYTNTQFPQRITAITDPYSRTARFFYDHNGRLTNITDTIGLVSSFKYDPTGVITNLNTAYGDTGFRHFETNNGSGLPLGRAIEISEPTGTKQLYVYRSELSSEAVGGFYTHDNVYPRYFNSFHWDRAQYAALSSEALNNYLEMPDADFLKASLKHWLQVAIGTLSDTLAAQAGPVADFTSGPVRVNQSAYQYQGQQAYYLVGTAKRITSIIWFSSTAFQQLDISRNTWGRPTSLTFHVGNESYTYNNYFDADGRVLQKVIGPRNELVRGYGYHAVYTNLLTSVTNAKFEVVRYTHDTNSLKMKLTSVSYPGGLVTTNFYNGAGFLERTIDLGIRTNSFVYQNGNLWYQTNELGLVTTNTWDNLGRLISTHYPDGTYTSNWFDKLDVVGTRDRMGYWTRYAFNAVRQRTYETNANGQVTQYTYCDCGSPSEITVWNGTSPVTTRYYHDIAGRMTNVVYQDNYSVTNSFDALSRLERITDSANRQATLSYNDYNQLLQVLVGQSGAQLTWLARQFDEYGRLTNSVDRNGVITTNSFDELGRMLDRRTIGGDLLVQSGLETFVYNERGLTNYTDPLGKITRFVRDAEGQVLSQTNANQEVLQFSYSPAGDIVTLTDGKDQVTKWNYNPYGQVTNKVDAQSAEMFRYQFDPNGRLTNRWQPGNITTTYKFDPVGNLTNVVYPNSGSIVLGYDYANRLTNMVDRVGTSGFSWTAAGQLAGEDGPWDNDGVSYGYTNRLRTSLGLAQPNASAWSQSYEHDDYWRLQALTSPAGTFTTSYKSVYASGAGYTASDLVEYLYQPSGAFTYNQHDGLGRLLSTVLENTAWTTLNSHAYEYNDGHQRTKQTFTAGNYVDYTYDEIGQLKTAKGKESGGTVRPQEQFGYAYDKAWNLNYRTNNALTQSFAVNNLNELTTLSRDGTMTVAGAVSTTPTSVTVKDNANSSQSATVYADNTFARENVTLLNGNNTFTAIAEDAYGRRDTNTVISYLPTSSSCSFDARGNLTNDGRRVFYYDDENQLTTVLVSNAWKSEFIYDGLMRRRVRKEFTWSASTWLQTNEVRYIYDGRLVIQERFFSPQPSTLIPQHAVTYTRGNDLSGTLQGAGGIGGLLARSEISNLQSPHAYYHADGNGNVTALLDTNQVLVARYHYDPYGSVLGMSGPLAEANLYRFSSKELHRNSGLVYYLFRYYEPALQRWINRDPSFEVRGSAYCGGAPDRLYNFVRNSPISNIDNVGLSTITISIHFDDSVANPADVLSQLMWSAERLAVYLSGTCCSLYGVGCGASVTMKMAPGSSHKPADGYHQNNFPFSGPVKETIPLMVTAETLEHEIPGMGGPENEGIVLMAPKSDGDIDPDVLAHELGHIASYKGDWDKYHSKYTTNLMFHEITEVPQVPDKQWCEKVSALAK